MSTHENVKRTDIKPPHFDGQKSIYFECKMENDFGIIISYIELQKQQQSPLTVNESFHYFIAKFSSILFHLL